MTDLVRSAAVRPAEEVRQRAGRVAAEPAAAQRSLPQPGARADREAHLAAPVGRALVRLVVRVLLVLGLALLALVFLEAWLPGVVVETLGSWLSR
jgi:hypothetical protein